VLGIIKKENLGHYHDNISQKTDSKGFRWLTMRCSISKLQLLALLRLLTSIVFIACLAAPQQPLRAENIINFELRFSVCLFCFLVANVAADKKLYWSASLSRTKAGFGH